MGPWIQMGPGPKRALGPLGSAPNGPKRALRPMGPLYSGIPGLLFPCVALLFPCDGNLGGKQAGDGKWMNKDGNADGVESSSMRFGACGTEMD